jgi:hypothetical protein
MHLKWLDEGPNVTVQVDGLDATVSTVPFKRETEGTRGTVHMGMILLCFACQVKQARPPPFVIEPALHLDLVRSALRLAGF